MKASHGLREKHTSFFCLGPSSANHHAGVLVSKLFFSDTPCSSLDNLIGFQYFSPELYFGHFFNIIDLLYSEFLLHQFEE